MGKKKGLKSHVQSKQKQQKKGWHPSGKQNKITPENAEILRSMGYYVDPKDITYQGQQYKGGREAGRKNLKKTAAGNLVNAHGVEFTPAEKRMLENEVNKANRKRKQMLAEEAAMSPRNKELQTMGRESDFILAQKSKSLQRFKSRKEFETYLSNVRRVNSPTYIEERTRLYKRNHMKALENEFGDDAKDIIMKIRMMKPEEYRKLMQSTEDLDVSYIYDPSAREGKLNQMRAALKMKLKEESIEL